MTRNSLTTWIAIPLFAAALAAAWWFVPQRRSPGGAELGAAFTLELDAFKRVDPALVLFEETSSFPLPLDAPRALAVDASDAVYVAGDRALLVFEPDGTLRRRHELGVTPSCVAVDEDGAIYLGSPEGVAVLAPDGTQTALWPADEKAILTSIAVKPGKIFVADAGHAAVLVYDATGARKGVIGGAGVRGPEGGPFFVVPSGHFDIAIGTDDYLWIVDPGRNIVRKVRDNGQFVSAWGESSVDIHGFSGCCNPSHIAIGPDGTFVTSEKGIVRVKWYDAAGAFLGVVAGPDAFDEGTMGIDLAVDSSRRVLALDPPRRQVRVFSKK